MLTRAVESVLAQTDSDFLHVIVNDGGDKARLESLLQPCTERYNGRLLLIDNDRSLGMEAASNIGIRSSASTYVAIHDDDDSWHPSFLTKMTCFLEAGFPLLKNLAGVVCYSTSVHER